MAKESFLLVSLNEDKAKDLAQVITNKSCRKILDFLADKKDATESEIAKKTKIPISTVHYNLQQLVKGGLVEGDEFHYSDKGKEVVHYKLANKFIVIAPKTTYGFKEKLKSILPVALILGAVGFLMQFFNRINPVNLAADEAAPIMMQKAVDTTSAVAEESLEVARAVPETFSALSTGDGGVGALSHIPNDGNIGYWFVIGVFIALICYLLVDFVLFKWRNKK